MDDYPVDGTPQLGLKCDFPARESFRKALLARLLSMINEESSQDRSQRGAELLEFAPRSVRPSGSDLGMLTATDSEERSHTEEPDDPLAHSERHGATIRYQPTGKRPEGHTRQKEDAVNLEDYIKDLAPELQERARACGSVEELLALAKEEKVPVPDEALEAVAGGDEGEVGKCFENKCPKCGCTRIGYQDEDLPDGWRRRHFRCTGCGYKFYKDYLPV